MESNHYNGKIYINNFGEDDQALFVGNTEFPFAQIWNEELAGKIVNVRYWISEKEMTKEQLKETALLMLSGAVEADYDVHYSEITGFLWADSFLKIGGHDFYDVLLNNSGKYLYLEVEII